MSVSHSIADARWFARKRLLIGHARCASNSCRSMSSPTGMCRPAVSEPHPARAPMARKTLRSMCIRAGMTRRGPPVSAPAAPVRARCSPRARARWRGLSSWTRLVAAASDYCNFGWLAGPAAGISKERCSAALLLLPAVPPALSSRAYRRSAMRCRPGRNGPMKSTTMASGLSAGAMATGCAFSAAVATTGPTVCPPSRNS